MPEQEIPHVRSKDYQVVYANYAQPGRTPWDIALLFSQVGESAPGEPAVIDQVTVILTPALAKALVGVLNAHVKEYERDNGVIAVPETVKRAFIERTEKAKPELEEIPPVAEPAEN